MGLLSEDLRSMHVKLSMSRLCHVQSPQSKKAAVQVKGHEFLVSYVL